MPTGLLPVASGPVAALVDIVLAQVGSRCHIHRPPLLVALLIGCTTTDARSVVPAPNPNGCYVLVFDHDGFSGQRNVFNGPARFSTLNLTSGGSDTDWNNRIRSLRVGETATLTIYTERGFTGRSMRFPARASHRQLEAAFSG